MWHFLLYIHLFLRKLSEDRRCKNAIVCNSILDRVNNGNGAEYLCVEISSRLEGDTTALVSPALMRTRSLRLGSSRVNCESALIRPQYRRTVPFAVFAAILVSSTRRVYTRERSFATTISARTRAPSRHAPTLLSLSLLICGRLVADECATLKRLLQ